jgi:hypothetical protein
MPPFFLNGMPAVGVAEVGVASEGPAAPTAGGRLRWNRGRRSSSPFLSNLNKRKKWYRLTRFVEIKEVWSLLAYKQLLSWTKDKNLTFRSSNRICYSQLPVIILKVMSWERIHERYQCCRSMKFWCGSGFADPCLWQMDLDPDPAIFVIDLQAANKKLI